MKECLCISTCAVKLLDALTLEERFKKALPLLSRQIEGLKLLKKTRKSSPNNEKRVTHMCICLFNHVCMYMPVDLSASVQVPSVRKGGVLRQFSRDEEAEDEDDDDTAVLEKKIHEAKMPEAAFKVCLKELKR